MNATTALTNSATVALPNSFLSPMPVGAASRWRVVWSALLFFYVDHARSGRDSRAGTADGWRPQRLRGRLQTRLCCPPRSRPAASGGGCGGVRSGALRYRPYGRRRSRAGAQRFAPTALGSCPCRGTGEWRVASRAAPPRARRPPPTRLPPLPPWRRRHASSVPPLAGAPRRIAALPWRQQAAAAPRLPPRTLRGTQDCGGGAARWGGGGERGGVRPHRCSGGLWSTWPAWAASMPFATGCAVSGAPRAQCVGVAPLEAARCTPRLF